MNRTEGKVPESGERAVGEYGLANLNLFRSPFSDYWLLRPDPTETEELSTVERVLKSRAQKRSRGR